MPEETKKEEAQRILATRTRETSSPAAYIRAGAVSGDDLAQASEVHPAFAYPPESFTYPYDWGAKIGLKTQKAAV